jgi:GNAT superfamily N-acetyltransferase
MMAKVEPKDAKTDLEIEKCFAVMSELRTHLKREEFLETVRGMEQDGYCLAFIEEEDRVVAAAGYRIHSTLFMGKHLYVDDLVTSESARSKGYGKLLLDWLRDKARSADCQYFRLDSGIARSQAHKFYFNQGFSIGAFSFSERLADS